jgi:hypothetical protein
VEFPVVAREDQVAAGNAVVTREVIVHTFLPCQQAIRASCLIGAIPPIPGRDLALTAR